VSKECLEIGLEPRAAVNMLRVPLIHLAAEMPAAVKTKGGAKRPRRLVQKEIFGKCVDGASERILAETLSLIGRLFEIYFVRLIGTPNQNSKSDANFGWHHSSSS
jgi:hypothetical protein